MSTTAAAAARRALAQASTPGEGLASRAHALELSPGQEPTPLLLYLLTLTTPQSRRSTLNNLRRAARVLGRTLDEMRWEEVRFTHLEAVKAWLLDREYHPSTVNATLSAMRGVARQAWRLGLLSVEVYVRIRDVSLARGSRVPRGRALAARELEGLLSAADRAECGTTAARDTALLALLAGAGLRRSEASLLTLESYRSESRSLVVRGKGNKERRVFLEDHGTHEALSAWLEVRGDSPGPLLCPVDRWGRLFRDRPLSHAAIYKIVRTRAREAGIESCSPHDLRHTFGTALLSGGADSADVQKLLGHARQETTGIYDHRDDESRRRACRHAYVPFSPRRKRKPKSARHHRTGRPNVPPRIPLPKKKKTAAPEATTTPEPPPPEAPTPAETEGPMPAAAHAAGA